MKDRFAENLLRCPRCHRDRALRLDASTKDEHEVREGTLVCTACGGSFPVHRGVGELMFNPPEHITREAAGLERFADVMRADGWDRERILCLPNLDDGYWYVQSRSMHQLLTTVHFQHGEWLLDVGSNTCWASNHFAVRGLNVIALDIATAEMQGLYTSDYFIEDATSYFERVLGSMYDMPIASGSLDYVFCCEVLHHNDEDSLRRTFQEAYRVLKPGGKVLVVNETIKTVKDPVGVHIEGVEQFEGYEHAFWALRYRWEATRAGFKTHMVEPAYHWWFDTPLPDRSPPAKQVVARLQDEMRRRKTGRRALLSWLNHIEGGVQLNMVATKPERDVLRGFRQRRARFG